MDIREELFDSAIKELDKSIEEYIANVKARIYDSIYHSYTKGLNDGRCIASAAQESLSIGDEVVYFDDESETIFPSNKFIITELDESDGGFIAGITEDGHTRFHDEPHWKRHWRRTGRHFNINLTLLSEEKDVEDH